MWQYTSSGRLDGYNGNLDMNIAYKDYPSIIKGADLNAFGNQVIETPIKPVETLPTLKFKKGDKVIVNGQLFANSNGGGAGKVLKNYKGTIALDPIEGRAKPYHIDGLGWVAEASLNFSCIL